MFDVGNATAAAIKRLKKGVAPEKAGGTGEKDNGNGSLMRIAPLAFYMFGIRNAEERFRIVRDVSSITHAHEWSVAACYIYVEMLNKLRMGRKKRAAYAELRDDFARGVPFISKATLAKFDRILGDDISTCQGRGNTKQRLCHRHAGSCVLVLYDHGQLQGRRG